MKFGLMFFSSGEDVVSRDKYGLVLACARFADQAGLSSIWVPERHFMSFGCLYPSPAVLLAALARETHRIALRAGSVVVPLHHPLRVVEEWSMLDNLSGGRVGIGCASGWQPDDFVFFPEKYATRRDGMFDDIRVMQRLWRGEHMSAHGGDGAPLRVRVYPTPLQPEMPLWIAAAGNPETFVKAGGLGANLLTYPVLFSHEDLKQRIDAYRGALAQAGHDPRSRTVTAWVQTYLHEDEATARARGFEALGAYFSSDARRLFSGLAAHHLGRKIDLDRLPEADLRDYQRFVCERLVARGMAIFGTPESCVSTVAGLAATGVDELACQLDFGIQPAQIVESLGLLARLSETYRGAQVRAASAPSAAAPVIEGRDAILARCPTEISGEDFYARAAALGLEYGPAFRCVLRAWRGDGEALAELAVPEALRAPGRGAATRPALLDGCFQALLAAVSADAPSGRGLPYFSGVRALTLMTDLPERAYCHARLAGDARRGELRGDVVILDDQSRVVAKILGIRGGYLERRSAARPADGATGDLYEIAWRPAPPAAPSPERPSSWVVFCDDGGSGDALIGALARAGQPCVAVRAGARYEVEGPLEVRIDPARADDYARLFDDLAARPGGLPEGVVHMWSASPRGAAELDLAALEAAQRVGAESALHLVQAVAPRRRSPPRIFLVTAGAVATGPGDVAPERAPVWGLGRTVQHELPEQRCTLIDLGLDATPADVDALAATLLAGEHAQQLAIRDGARHVPRLARAPAIAAAADRPILRGDSAYLVTGGLGGLGIGIAEWMIAAGAGAVVLAGRRGPERGSDRVAQDALDRLGSRAVVVAADVSREADVAGLLERAGRLAPPLRGVFHLAATLDDGLLGALDPDRIRKVMAPKAAGAWNLHRATARRELDFFVMFSSVASMLGSPGQANYAAANALLDALAHHRRARGLPALSINWGLWADLGLAATVSERRRAQLAAFGMKAIEPARGTEILGALLAHGAGPQVCVLPVDWSRAGPAIPEGARQLLAELISVRAGDPGRRRDLIEQIRRVPVPDGLAILIGYVAGQIAAATATDASEIDPRQPVSTLGVDSLTALDLRDRIAQELGVDIPVVRLLEDVDIAGIADLLGAELRRDAPPSTRAVGLTPLDASDLLARLDGLPDGELDGLLQSLQREEGVLP